MLKNNINLKSENKIMKVEIANSKRQISVLKKSFSINKSDLSTIEILDLITRNCAEFDYGREVTLSDIVIYALRKLKIEDAKFIKEGTLSAEEKVLMSLAEFNKQNGTQLTMAELAMKQLKKEKREALQ